MKWGLHAVGGACVTGLQVDPSEGTAFTTAGLQKYRGSNRRELILGAIFKVIRPALCHLSGAAHAGGLATALTAPCLCVQQPVALGRAATRCCQPMGCGSRSNHHALLARILYRTWGMRQPKPCSEGRGLGVYLACRSGPARELLVWACGSLQPAKG